MKQVLIFGPISWDTVIRIEKYPENGGFAQGLMRDERAGGVGMNLAAAVSSASINTKLYSYIGTDDIGRNLQKELQNLNIDGSNIKEIPGASLHAIITIDSVGERTIFALEKNRFAEIDFQVNFEPNQIVVFPVWRDFYISHLEEANRSGALTVVGMGAINNPNVTAAIMIGSEKDISQFMFDADRFETTIITRGGDGVRVLTSDGARDFPVSRIAVRDATGAGDSFLSGVVVGLARGNSLESAIRMGINWAAAALSKLGSLPPKWREDFNLA